MSSELNSTSTSAADISQWRSIVTLVVFILTNILVLLPCEVPLPVPRALSTLFFDVLGVLRITSSRQVASHPHSPCGPPCSSAAIGSAQQTRDRRKHWICVRLPLNFITAPVMADLLLLAIRAIGREEVYGGIIGTNNIAPYEIMIFFLTLAYIAISIDASGLIRYLAFRVLQWGGSAGRRLYFYMYAFFFVLGSFIGNDPIILSGTAFLAYMTRVASNIAHPRAWIHTQFAVANIASAILVSSNPTNLVLAGAFQIKFVEYTVNMIVPVAVTIIILFPLLLHLIFSSERLIPPYIQMHQLSEEVKARKPVNPNIPRGRARNGDKAQGAAAEHEPQELLSLEEIMNPFLDKKGAIFGAVVMATALITLLTINAVSSGKDEHPVYWVTLPAAVIMFSFDLFSGWIHRHEMRDIARQGCHAVQEVLPTRVVRIEGNEVNEHMQAVNRRGEGQIDALVLELQCMQASPCPQPLLVSQSGHIQTAESSQETPQSSSGSSADPGRSIETEYVTRREIHVDVQEQGAAGQAGSASVKESQDILAVPMATERGADIENREQRIKCQEPDQKATLVSVVTDTYYWCHETFPTVTTVLTHLPFALVPFAFAMFILVQALVVKGWVPVFAHGWDHWVNMTGTVGSIAGMGFLSVILCNFAGTNIGTAILLSRVIQTWQQVHDTPRHGPITNRTFWGTIYSMALGLNYGAFSTAFSASLAGLLWRDILARKHIYVRQLDFARVNLPIIASAMSVGCAVLVGQIYLTRDTHPHSLD